MNINKVIYFINWIYIYSKNPKEWDLMDFLRKYLNKNYFGISTFIDPSNFQFKFKLNIFEWIQINIYKRCNI